MKPRAVRRSADALLARLAGANGESPREYIRPGEGLFSGTDDIAARWVLDRRFEPVMSGAARNALYDGWKSAVARIGGTH